MINSQTLKTFVKMHEHKLNAKVQALQAGGPHSRLEYTGTDGLFELTDMQHGAAGRAGRTARFETPENRRRPKSHYFNLIVTG